MDCIKGELTEREQRLTVRPENKKGPLWNICERKLLKGAVEVLRNRPNNAAGRQKRSIFSETEVNERAIASKHASKRVGRTDQARESLSVGRKNNKIKIGKPW